MLRVFSERGHLKSEKVYKTRRSVSVVRCYKELAKSLREIDTGIVFTRRLCTTTKKNLFILEYVTDLKSDITDIENAQWRLKDNISNGNTFNVQTPLCDTSPSVKKSRQFQDAVTSSAARFTKVDVISGSTYMWNEL